MTKQQSYIFNVIGLVIMFPIMIFLYLVAAVDGKETLRSIIKEQFSRKHSDWCYDHPCQVDY